MSSDAPGPAPDRAVLARAEADWRATPPDLAGWVSLSRDASKALMAEYDRRGAELDRQRTELADIHKEVVDKPGSTHAEVMSTLKWLWEQSDELGEMRPQWRHRGEVIKAAADAAGHADEFPGRGLAEHVAGLRAELDRQRVIVRAAEALVECVNEGHDLDDNSDHPLWNRLDALAAAVRAARPEGETE